MAYSKVQVRLMVGEHIQSEFSLLPSTLDPD